LGAFVTSTSSAAINYDNGNNVKAIGDLTSALGNLAGAAGSFATQLNLKPLSVPLNIASSPLGIVGLGVSNYDTLPGDVVTALGELKLQIQEGEVLIINDAFDSLNGEWNEFKVSFSNATSKVINYIDNFGSSDVDLYAQEAIDAVNAVKGTLDIIADSEGITLEGITIDIDDNNNFTISTDSTLDIIAGANVNIDVNGYITDLKTTLENGAPTSDVVFDEYNANITNYQSYSDDIILGIARELGISVDDLFTVANNDYLTDRKFTLDNGAVIYLFKDGDSLNVTPADNDFDYVAYNFTDKDKTTIDVSQVQTGVGTEQDAILNMPIPAKNVSYTDANGNTTNYYSVIGNSQDFLDENFSDLTGIDISGLSEIYDSANNLSYINDNAQATAGGQQISFKSIVDMVEKGASGFANFMTEVITNTGGYVATQAPALVGQIVSRIIQGEDIEDIAEEIAIQTVAAGAVESLAEALGDEFYLLHDLQASNVLATEAIKGAITQVAVTAIINGSEAGFEDYATAAASAGVSRVISEGVLQYGHEVFVEQIPLPDVGLLCRFGRGLSC